MTHTSTQMVVCEMLFCHFVQIQIQHQDENLSFHGKASDLIRKVLLGKDDENGLDSDEESPAPP